MQNIRAVSDVVQGAVIRKNEAAHARKPTQGFSKASTRTNGVRSFKAGFAAEDTGFEPATGKPATDFESAP